MTLGASRIVRDALSPEHLNGDDMTAPKMILCDNAHGMPICETHRSIALARIPCDSPRSSDDRDTLEKLVPCVHGGICCCCYGSCEGCLACDDSLTY